jgi:hypothetical protein
MTLKTTRQILKEASPKKEYRDIIKLVAITTTGTITVVEINDLIEKKLELGEAIPSYFIGAVQITDYLIAPIYFSHLSRKYGQVKARDMIARLRMYLETCKAKSLIDKDIKRLVNK